MRKIKFRAWDGTNLYDFDNHAYDLIYNDISGWNIAPNTPNYKGEWLAGESSKTAEHFRLIEFTGRKDKNGKEIYEGDQVHFTVIEDVLKAHTSESTGVIEWDEEDATFYILNDNDKFPHVKFWYAKDIVVTGNIFTLKN